MNAQPLQQGEQKQAQKKELRKKMIRDITNKVCDRNDEALRRLAKN